MKETAVDFSQGTERRKARFDCTAYRLTALTRFGNSRPERTNKRVNGNIRRDASVHSFDINHPRRQGFDALQTSAESQAGSIRFGR